MLRNPASFIRLREHANLNQSLSRAISAQELPSLPSLVDTPKYLETTRGLKRE